MSRGSRESHFVDYAAVRGDRDSDRWAPLRVSCQVQTPIIDWGDGLYLDGPLAWARYAEYRHRFGDDLPDVNTADWLVDFDLPVAKWAASPMDGVDCERRLLTADGKLWGWCVSRAFPGDHLSRKESIRGKPPTEQYKQWTDADRVKTSTGPDKPVDKTYPTTVTNRLVWYVLGGADEVRQLLERVTAIGARRNVGFGEIETNHIGVGQWEVDHIEEDRSLTHNGRLMRRMPYGWAGFEKPARMMSVRAPHWHSCRRHMLMEADRGGVDGHPT